MKRIKLILSVFLLINVNLFLACSNASSNSDSSSKSKPEPETDAYIGTKAPGETKELGDIIFTDGSAISYKYADKMSIQQKKSAIAIIYYVGTDCTESNDIDEKGKLRERILGVGLVHSGGWWCDKTADAFGKNINTIICDCDSYSVTSGYFTFNNAIDKDGRNNLEQIEAFEGVNDTSDSSKYPAFYFAINYKDAIHFGDSESRIKSDSEFATGWYLPTMAELYYIYIFRDSIANLDALSSSCGGDLFGNYEYWSSSLSKDSSAADSTSCGAPFLSFENGGIGFYTSGGDPQRVCAIREFN